MTPERIVTGLFIDPYASLNVISEIEAYMKKHNMENINDIVGKVEMN